MAYFTWAEVATRAGGEKRFRDAVMAGHSDTSDDHPWFDRMNDVVSRKIDAQLQLAGLAYPLETPIADHDLRMNGIDYLIGKLSETSDKRAQWMADLQESGLAYIMSIGAGDTPVLAAEDAEDQTETQGQILGSYYRDHQFDIAHPDATIHDVFPDLGPSWRR
jgi:hypothetical protein